MFNNDSINNDSINNDFINNDFTNNIIDKKTVEMFRDIHKLTEIDKKEKHERMSMIVNEVDRNLTEVIKDNILNIGFFEIDPSKKMTNVDYYIIYQKEKQEPVFNFSLKCELLEEECNEDKYDLNKLPEDIYFLTFFYKNSSLELENEVNCVFYFRNNNNTNFIDKIVKYKLESYKDDLQAIITIFKDENNDWRFVKNREDYEVFEKRVNSDFEKYLESLNNDINNNDNDNNDINNNDINNNDINNNDIDNNDIDIDNNDNDKN